MRAEPMNAIAGLGQIMQLAYVPADFDGALAHWLKMGAGPFFALDHVVLEDLRYRGQPADIDFSMLLGYWGDLQIELIRQHNDAPSIYTAWRDQNLEGLHHVCLLVEDMEVAPQPARRRAPRSNRKAGSRAAAK